MTLTKARTLQYIGILFALGLIAVGYWYWSARAGVKTNTSVSQPQGTGRLDSGLAGYWKLDEGSGTTASDASTNGNNGTLTNGPTWTTGQIGSAVDFDGSNDYISVPDNSALDMSSAVSISAWIKADTWPSGIATILKKDGNYALRKDAFGSAIRMYWWDGANIRYIDTASLPSTGTWHHIVGTAVNDDAAAIYVDGVLASTGSPATLIASSETSTNIIEIGSGASGTESLDGKLDEVRVYNRALPPDEVRQIYQLTSPTGVDSNLKGYWSFNGQDTNATTVFDRSGTGLSGTLVNGPTITSGKLGQAMSFDGVNDYIDYGGYPTEQTIYSMTFWWYQTGTSSGTLLHRGDSGACFYNPRIDINTTALSYAEPGCSGSGIIGGVNLAVGWHHIAVTRKGSEARLYADGLRIPTTGTPQANGPGGSERFYVGAGRNNGAVGGYANAKIDELRVYDRTLDDDEIKSLYDTSAADKANSSVSQPQGNGRLDSGLVGYWPLDTGSGTTATDLSTNANNGTLTNGPTWTAGHIGSGVDFDGTNDYIGGIPMSGGLALATNTVSISFWARTDVVAYNSVIQAVTDDGSNRLNIHFPWNDSTIYWDYGDAFGNGRLTASWDSGWTGQWAYWTFISEPGVGQKIYRNGNLIASDGTTSTFTSGSKVLEFGRYGGGGAYWDGGLDEVRIYDRALSAEEITQLYRLNTPTGVDTSLKGYWSFDGQDTKATTAFDRSGAGNIGTLTNGPTKTLGIAGQALSFDGSDDYVGLGNAANVQLSNGTLSAWIKTTDASGTKAIFTKGEAYGLFLDSGIFKIYDWGAATFRSTGMNLADNQWHFVVATFASGVSNGTKLLVDGRLVLTTTMTVANQSVDLAVGQNTGTQRFNGIIDESRLYNRLLSESEVSALYAAGAPDKTNTSVSQPQGTGRLDSGLAGYWKLDENTGTSAADTSTNGNTGTLNNGPTWTTGQIGSAVTFDGSNDYISVSDTDVLDPSVISIVAWIKVSTCNDGNFVSKGGNSGYRMRVNSNCTISLADRGGTNFFTGNRPVSTGVWTHIVGVGDASGLKIYINGVFDSSNTTAYGGPNTADTFQIGASTDLAIPEFFTGSVDEVRIYSRTLSADEISQLYRITTPTGTDSSLKGYWSFNGQDVSATNAFDRSGSGNNGTLTNGPTKTIGKLGQALSFDGSNDYVDIGDKATLEGLSNLTLSAWVNPTSFASYNSIVTKELVYKLDIDTSGHLRFLTSTDGTSWNNTIVSTAVLPANQWTHVVGVYGGSGVTKKVYINGVQDPTTSAASLQLGTNAISFEIGAYDGSNSPFVGKIDEVRIYNRTFEPAEIQALYQQGK